MMASGIPVIAFSTGGNPELIKHNESGILVETGNIRMLAEAIISLLTDSIKRRTIGVRARIRVEKHFRIMNNTQATTDIYSMLGRKRHMRQYWRAC